jgi:hypothetical protein
VLGWWLTFTQVGLAPTRTHTLCSAHPYLPPRNGVEATISTIDQLFNFSSNKKAHLKDGLFYF